MAFVAAAVDDSAERSSPPHLPQSTPVLSKSNDNKSGRGSALHCPSSPTLARAYHGGGRRGVRHHQLISISLLGVATLDGDGDDDNDRPTGTAEEAAPPARHWPYVSHGQAARAFALPFFRFRTLGLAGAGAGRIGSVLGTARRWQMARPAPSFLRAWRAFFLGW